MSESTGHRRLSGTQIVVEWGLPSESAVIARRILAVALRRADAGRMRQEPQP